MVHKFQELDNYDDYDPVPYMGGYDLEAAYGSVKPADEESAYRRAEFGEDEEEQEVQYGGESNPYENGPPGPPISGGHPRPGGVYGGGRDRTRPSEDEAQPDEGVETGYGRRRPVYEEESEEYRKPVYGEEESGYSQPSYGGEEESGYRKPRPAYGEEETEDSECRQTRYNREERNEQYSSYGRTSYGDEAPAEEEGEGGYGGDYGRKKRDDDEEEEEGYEGRRKKYDDDEEGGYRSRRNDDEEEDGYRPRRNDDEEEEGYRPRRNEDEERSEERKSWW
jgi:hypothetical protein